MTQTLGTTDFSFAGQTGLYHGKVRDMYSFGDELLVAVATDRISAFDVVLPCLIPYKGQVLNQLAAYLLESSRDIVPNWLMEVPDPNVSAGHRAEPFQLEIIIRSLLVGSAWREYKTGARTLCGESLPDGLREYDRLPMPIVTPTTKAAAGHDENISFAEAIEQKLLTDEDAETLTAYSRQLFAHGQELARQRGLLLADTKYEFGKLGDQIILIDEIHTPDSSRYFYTDSYETYATGDKTTPPRHLSKEFVREWLVAHGFDGQPEQALPEMNDKFAQMVSERYVELYETLTGQTFAKTETDDILKRIDTNITNYLTARTA